MPALILALATLLTLQSAPPSAALIRVYVMTDDGGDGAERRGRLESVEQLADALATKKKTLRIVDKKEFADVVVTVDERTSTVPSVALGLGPRPGQGAGAGAGSSNAPVRSRELKLRVLIEFGSDRSTLRNKNAPLDTAGGWKSAADDLAKQIEQWVKDRHERIVAARK